MNVPESLTYTPVMVLFEGGERSPAASSVQEVSCSSSSGVSGSYGQKPVILVLMHHTRDVEYSTDGRRWSDEYDNVVLDVHVLFHETENGLLRCPNNDLAVNQIQKELQKHSKHRSPF